MTDKEMDDKAFFDKMNGVIPEENKELVNIQKTINAYKSLNNNIFGKVVLDDLFKFCKYGEVVFTNDPLANAFKQGVQSVSVYINQQITTKEQN